MNRAWFFVAASVLAASVAGAAASAVQDRALMGALMRMELAGEVVAEAGKMSDLPEVAAAAEGERDRLFALARDGLVMAFGDEARAQDVFAAFVDAVQASPADYAGLRGEVAERELAPDLAGAGQFLGNVQSWVRLRAKGKVPPLQAWLDRDGAPAGTSASQSKPAKKRKHNPLRDAEVGAGAFTEEMDEGGSTLETFRAAREARRQKALMDSESGMAQVQEERRIADEEDNARKQAAAAAEAAAMQSQAQHLAAAEQDAIIQDQNSWRTRVKNIAATAIGATGSAFLGTVGGRVGEEAARAVFNDPKPPPR